MSTVLLVVHLMIAAAMVFIVLIQKSEGGALGIGGGGGFLSGRGKSNLLTRVTAGLAAAFFTTSLMLTILAKRGPTGSAFDTAPAASTTAPATAPAAPGAPAPASDAPRGGILDKLK